MISKDATASVFQHLVKILGGKTDQSYKFCNLDSEDTWYDTYTLVINDWKQQKKILIRKNEIDNFDEIFNRSNLKKQWWLKITVRDLKNVEKSFMN
jgi:hypothetical protein